MNEEQPQIQLRLTGNRRDITGLLATLETLNSKGWRIDLNTTKTRHSGTIQTYATATKEEQP